MTDLVLVPRYPTDAMWHAFFKHHGKPDDAPFSEFNSWHGDFGNFAYSFGEAVAAAPKEEVTHHPTCYREHPACAVAIQRLRENIERAENIVWDCENHKPDNHEKDMGIAGIRSVAQDMAASLSGLVVALQQKPVDRSEVREAAQSMVDDLYDTAALPAAPICNHVPLVDGGGNRIPSSRDLSCVTCAYCGEPIPKSAAPKQEE